MVANIPERPHVKWIKIIKKNGRVKSATPYGDNERVLSLPPDGYSNWSQWAEHQIGVKEVAEM